MAYTAPRTWVAGELVTAAQLNTHLRDNLNAVIDSATGVLAPPLGTALLPSYVFVGDLNTGMWSPAADTIAWSTGGTERMRLSSTVLTTTGDIEFTANNTHIRMANSGAAVRDVFGIDGSDNFRVGNVDFGNEMSFEVNSGPFTWNKTGPVELMRLDGNSNLGIGTATFDGSADSVVAIANGTAPAAGTANQSYIYAKDVASSSEMHVMDEAGNETLISPHDVSTGEWIFFSRNVFTGRVVRVDMERLVRACERVFGEQFMTDKVVNDA